MSNQNHAAGACPVPSTAARLETRGVVWLIAAFLFCPCHLPLTLGLMGLLLAGTTVGALLQGHPLLAGVLVTAVWAAGTWRGFRLINAARRFADSRSCCRLRPSARPVPASPASMSANATSASTIVKPRVRRFSM